MIPGTGAKAVSHSIAWAFPRHLHAWVQQCCSPRGFLAFKHCSRTKLPTAKRSWWWGNMQFFAKALPNSLLLLALSLFLVFTLSETDLPCYCCVQHFNCVYNPSGHQGKETAHLLSCQLHAAVQRPVTQHRCDPAAPKHPAQPRRAGGAMARLLCLPAGYLRRHKPASCTARKQPGDWGGTCQTSEIKTGNRARHPSSIHSPLTLLATGQQDDAISVL